MSPTISVITVTFNAAEVLPGLIESLRAQTDREFEWIVIDGNSSDGTVALIKNASDVISHWLSEDDFGIYDAMNKGVRLAHGKYYLVCGADDRLAPSAIANYRMSVLSSDADMVSATVETSSGLIRPNKSRSWLIRPASFVSFHSVGLLIRRDLHSQYGYYSRRFPIAADQYFIKSVCLNPHSQLLIGNFVAGYYSLDGVSGADVPGTMTEIFRIQLETEPYQGLQILLFGLRLLRHYARIATFGRTKRIASIRSGKLHD